ncbi:hypothetical protein HEQ72_08080 [Haematospirillum sp. 15-248]|uniref:helix-turn-helix transcriptional regulator n=1 Tax=Haematospirillum sp. 15-248 TaxID=2723107 RepID=UPI00143B1F95|nr:autoinducer binding domain-containing protein [Haematospirillum sp. 15-248]NKD55603.1 hypothetical protein [Haematospirillum sp. H4890]NKD75742.1 hypothetical protein [Haematospirillum sp. H4485]NKD88266.1 hypothetical protein [Haematospirillum sp. 15-248]
MVEDVKSLVDCKSTKELFESICSEASGLGFEHVAFLGVAGDDAASFALGYPFVLSSLPVEWQRRYIDCSYHKLDPTVRLAPFGSTVMIWSKLRRLAPDFFDEARSFGLCTGLSVPVRLPRRVYLLSFATARKEEVTKPVRSALAGLSFGFVQEYVKKSPPVPVSIDLHENTLKILHMSLAGFSNEAMAASLGMTVHGISWHLRDAREKLRCQTTLHACGKALSLGLIDL